MKVVSNASPVIIFARAGFLPLIEGLFGEILVSADVYQEMTAPTKPGIEAIRKAKSIKKLQVKDPNRFLASKAYGVSTADTTVIALQVMGDEEFNRWSRELAQEQAEEGQAIICVNIKRIRETRSRIEELELAEVIGS